jgi:hypothetical protein
MGTTNEYNSLLLVREIAARQGVQPADEDIAAVQRFLDNLLSQLIELEEHLPPETPA